VLIHLLFIFISSFHLFFLYDKKIKLIKMNNSILILEEKRKFTPKKYQKGSSVSTFLRIQFKEYI